MKLFLISQTTNDNYDTYDSAVVAAPDAETARQMNPATGDPIDNWKQQYSAWCDAPSSVHVQYLGEATDDVEQGVVCASYNAG